MQRKYLHKTRQSIIVYVVLLTQRDKALASPKNKNYFYLMWYVL